MIKINAKKIVCMKKMVLYWCMVFGMQGIPHTVFSSERFSRNAHHKRNEHSKRDGSLERRRQGKKGGKKYNSEKSLHELNAWNNARSVGGTKGAGSCCVVS